MPVVAGVDLSLTHTGVAIAAGGEMHLVWGVKSRKAAVETLRTRDARQREIVRKVLDELIATGVVAMAIEGPSYGSNTGSQHDRSGLWWRLVTTAHSCGIEVIEVPPTVRAKYATGKGNGSKDEVLAAVVRRYPEVEVDDNNHADAVVLAAIAARLVGQPVEASLPKAHLEAMEKLSGFSEDLRPALVGVSAS